MWLAAITVTLVGCLLPARADTEIYREVGEEVQLMSGWAPEGILTSISWKHDRDLAMEYYEGSQYAYRQFKERGTLNLSSGAMTIKGLTLDDGGIYTAEINDRHGTPIRLIVLLPLPKPTVSMSCNSTSCTLTCDANTTHCGPVTYTWMSGDSSRPESSKVILVTKEETSAEHGIICELHNPVSKERSQPVHNPFTPGSTVSPRSAVGVTVFISLLLVVLILVSFHRYRTGMWFFQKASMPWEADFWRRQEMSRIPCSDALETNVT